MDRNDIKEKLIILGISIGIFLPLRLLLTAYVSDHWIGSVGLMSALAVLMVILIKMKKLGWFGRMFEKQMRKTVGGKTGKIIIAFAIFFMFYFGATLFFIDRGNTIYQDDKEVFYFAIIGENGYSINNISTYDLMGPQTISNLESGNLQNLAKLDYMFSVAYAVMDDMSEGWLSHVLVIMFVEQIEAIGLLIFFRNTFKQVKQVRPA